MLHIRALRGFVPANLVVDTKGFVPLLGDEIKRFNFIWHAVPKSSLPILQHQRKGVFSVWCFSNTTILGKTMTSLSKWKGAIDCFEKECWQEREKLELWHSDISDIDPI